MPSKLNSPQRPWELKKTEGKQTGRLEETDFYNSPAWKRTRKAYITAHPLCDKHEKMGIVVIATVVDHKKPIRQGGDALSWDNLQSLCDQCHNSKSGKERHGIYENE